MLDIERLRIIVHRFDPESMPDLDADVFGADSIRDLAFLHYNSNRDQRREPWLTTSDPFHRNRVLLWLKNHRDVLYDI